MSEMTIDSPVSRSSGFSIQPNGMAKQISWLLASRGSREKVGDTPRVSTIST